MSKRKIMFVGQFSDPQVEIQMIEVVKTTQTLLDDVYVSHENILNIQTELEGKETKVGSSAKANQAEANAKQYTDEQVIIVKEYVDTKVSEVDIYQPIGGPTSDRPLSTMLYNYYFDTTLNKPIWWTGTKWVDANGNEV